MIDEIVEFRLPDFGSELGITIRTYKIGSLPRNLEGSIISKPLRLFSVSGRGVDFDLHAPFFGRIKEVRCKAYERRKPDDVLLILVKADPTKEPQEVRERAQREFCWFGSDLVKNIVSLNQEEDWKFQGLPNENGFLVHKELLKPGELFTAKQKVATVQYGEPDKFGSYHDVHWFDIIAEEAGVLLRYISTKDQYNFRHSIVGKTPIFKYIPFNDFVELHLRLENEKRCLEARRHEDREERESSVRKEERLILELRGTVERQAREIRQLEHKISRQDEIFTNRIKADKEFHNEEHSKFRREIWDLKSKNHDIERQLLQSQNKLAESEDANAKLRLEADTEDAKHIDKATAAWLHERDEQTGLADEFYGVLIATVVKELDEYVSSDPVAMYDKHSFGRIAQRFIFSTEGQDSIFSWKHRCLSWHARRAISDCNAFRKGQLVYTEIVEQEIEESLNVYDTVLAFAEDWQEWFLKWLHGQYRAEGLPAEIMTLIRSDLERVNLEPEQDEFVDLYRHDQDLLDPLLESLDRTMKTKVL